MPIMHGWEIKKTNIFVKQKKEAVADIWKGEHEEVVEKILHMLFKLLNTSSSTILAFLKVFKLLPMKIFHNMYAV